MFCCAVAPTQALGVGSRGPRRTCCWIVGAWRRTTTHAASGCVWAATSARPAAGPRCSAATWASPSPGNPACDGAVRAVFATTSVWRSIHASVSCARNFDPNTLCVLRTCSVLRFCECCNNRPIFKVIYEIICMRLRLWCQVVLSGMGFYNIITSA